LSCGSTRFPLPGPALVRTTGPAIYFNDCSNIDDVGTKHKGALATLPAWTLVTVFGISSASDGPH
jgi:hypothetical protein